MLLALLSACSGPAQPALELQPEPGPEVMAKLQQLRERFGLDLGLLKRDDPRIPVWTRLGMNFNKDSAYPLQSRLFTQMGELVLLEEELAKYPEGFFRQVPINGLYWAPQLENGPPFFRKSNDGVGMNAFNTRIAIINIGSYQSWSRSMVRTLHHELFHTVDDRILTGYPAWERCNPAGTSYQFFAEQPTRERARRHPEPGFVTAYARTGAHEDRADVFSMLMAGPVEAQLLQSWIDRGDTSLACKVEVMRAYLREHFPAFDQTRLKFVQLGLKGESLARALAQAAELKSLDLSLRLPEEAAPATASPANPSAGFASPSYTDPYQGSYGTAYGTGYGTAYGSSSGYGSAYSYGSGYSSAYGYGSGYGAAYGSAKSSSYDTGYDYYPGGSGYYSYSYFDGIQDPTLGEELVMPATIGEFTGLEHLRVARVGYTDLPPELAKLQQLKSLELNDARFTRLPEAIYALKSLQELVIGGIDLTIAPDRLSELSALEKLSLHLDTTSPPAFLKGLSRLRKLELSLRGNQEIPRLFEGLQRLEELSLSGFSLRLLPENIGDLASLRSLEVQAPKLQKLPSRFRDLQQLETLILRNNSMRKFPPELLKLGKLTRLELQGNGLYQLPPELLELPRLKYLDLSGNALALEDLSGFRQRADERGIELRLDYQLTPREWELSQSTRHKPG